MRKFNPHFRFSKKKGLAPGDITYTGEHTGRTVIDSHSFADKRYSYDIEIEDIIRYRSDLININGLSNIEKIKKIGDLFSIHDMWLEDITNVHSQAYYEKHEDQHLVVFKFPVMTGNNLEYEHIGTVLTADSGLICFQSTEKDRIERSIESLKNYDPELISDSYIFLRILDFTVDEYGYVSEKFASRIEEKVTDMSGMQDNSFVFEVDDIRRDLFILSRRADNLSKILLLLKKDEDFSDHILLVNDIYSHIDMIIQNIRYFQDVLKDSKDTYNSLTNDRINKRMNILAVVGALFTPLTFLAGIYGMNFSHMPELEYRYSYFILLGVMAVIFISLLVYFIRKGWFGGR